jgi:hypothetical protein
VYGKTDSTVGGAGVMGEGVAGGPGVIGKSQHWHGVYGETSGTGESGAAAVWGENKSDGSGVVGHSLNGAGIYAKSEHGSAAVLDGKLDVRGDISVTGRVIGNVEIDGANHITGNVEIDGTLTVKGAALDPAKIWQALSDLQAEIGSLEAQVTELQAQIEALASK